MSCKPSLEDVLRNVVRDVLRDEIPAAVNAAIQASRSCEAPAEADVYLTVERAAEIASVHSQTVRKWQRKKLLRLYHAGAAPRVRLSELHAFLARDQHDAGRVDLDERARGILSRRTKERP